MSGKPTSTYTGATAKVVVGGVPRKSPATAWSNVVVVTVLCVVVVDKPKVVEDFTVVVVEDFTVVVVTTGLHAQ